MRSIYTPVVILKVGFAEEYNNQDLIYKSWELTKDETARMQQIAKELGKIWALEEEIKVDKDLGINVF